MNLREWKSNLFRAFEGDWDAEEALRAGHALDPDCAHAYTEHAITRQLTADYKTWLRSRLRRIRRDVGTPEVERLFDVPGSPDLRSIRETVLIDGTEYRLDSLTGEEGVAVLRRIALRDERAAKTMLSRCSVARRLADAVEAASKKAGRPVSVAEVLEERAA